MSGFKPDEDIEIKFSGVRPGEKLFEELATDAEHASKTKHPKIFIGRIATSDAAVAHSAIDDLLALALRPEGADSSGIRCGLKVLVPEYSGAPTTVTPAAAGPVRVNDAPSGPIMSAAALEEARLIRNQSASGSHPRIASVT